MAAGKEQQQAHRPGVYKQKNKQHKHGKHRTKGEIGRENKGNPGRFIFLIVFLLFLPFFFDSRHDSIQPQHVFKVHSLFRAKNSTD